MKIYSQNSKNKDDKPITLPYSNRTTLEAFKEIEEVLLNLQKEDHHRGRRIVYKMHPISNLMEFTPELNIKNQSFFSTPKPFFVDMLSQQEKFEMLLTKVHSLYKDMTKYNEFVKNSHIQSTKNILLKAKKELKGIQENLATFLISNRKGEKTGVTSETIMNGYKSLIKNLESYVYRDWMPFYAKIDYIFYLKKKNVQVQYCNFLTKISKNCIFIKIYHFWPKIVIFGVFSVKKGYFNTKNRSYGATKNSNAAKMLSESDSGKEY